MFDWDRTLSVLEMGEFDISSNNKKVIVKRVFGSAERFTNLLDMLNSLKEANVKLAILSFNSSHLIKKCLRIVMHDAELFTHVYGFEDVPSIGQFLQAPQPKSITINNNFPPSSTEKNMLFVDDNIKNIDDVRNHTTHCTVLHVTSCGMTLDNFVEVKNWI